MSTRLVEKEVKCKTTPCTWSFVLKRPLVLGLLFSKDRDGWKMLKKPYGSHFLRFEHLYLVFCLKKNLNSCKCIENPMVLQTL